MTKTPGNKLGLLTAVGAALLCAACSSGRKEKLQEALGRAQLPLSASVDIAEQNVQRSTAVKAALLVDADPVYAVGALATGNLHDVRVDITDGRVLGNVDMGASSVPCPGAVGLVEAITIAESSMSGSAVSIQPDDDNECDREVQVLSAGRLWEVKVGPDGTVIEVELSDDD